MLCIEDEEVPRSDIAVRIEGRGALPLVPRMSQLCTSAGKTMYVRVDVRQQ